MYLYLHSSRRVHWHVLVLVLEYICKLSTRTCTYEIIMYSYLYSKYIPMYSAPTLIICIDNRHYLVTSWF